MYVYIYIYIYTYIHTPASLLPNTALQNAVPRGATLDQIMDHGTFFHINTPEMRVPTILSCRDSLSQVSADGIRYTMACYYTFREYTIERDAAFDRTLLSHEAHYETRLDRHR